jgi:hypothetical protein
LDKLAVGGEQDVGREKAGIVLVGTVIVSRCEDEQYKDGVKQLGEQLSKY